MKQYHDLLQDVLDNGFESSDRTGTGTKSVFGRQIRFDLRDGFPLLTTKKIHWKSVLIELLWLMRGETNIAFLKKHRVRIWDEWSNPDGDLGEVYGKNWRKWEDTQHVPFSGCSVDLVNKGYKVIGLSTINGESHQVLFRKTDQIKDLIERIKTKPDCRRLIVSAWNAGRIDQMALPPCHTLVQFYVRDGKISCHLYQRSADMFLGVPFNIASYAAMTHLIANECGLQVADFIHTFGDAHIYNNHIDQVKEILSRSEFPLPKIEINLEPGKLLDWIDNEIVDLSYDQIKDKISISNYQSHDTIKADVSV